MTVFDDALTAIFNTDVAVDGIYTPPGPGTPVDVRVVESLADVETSIGGTAIQSEAATFEIQVSSLAQAPVKGGTLTLVDSGLVYLITAKPQKIDANGLIWKIQAPPQ